MTVFLTVLATALFAAGQKEEPPQKVLYRILNTAKEGNAKAVDKEFAPISVDILPSVLYEEEAARRIDENGQTPVLSLPKGTIPISSFDDFREIMKYFDFKIRGNAFRTDENGNRIFIGYVDITNRRFEPYFEAVCLPDGEENAVFSEIDGETLFENVREYIKRDDKLTEMYPSFPLTLVYRDNRWVPDMEKKESINAWNMAMSPYCPPDKAEVKRLIAKLFALSDKKTAPSSEHTEEKESGSAGGRSLPVSRVAAVRAARDRKKKTNRPVTAVKRPFAKRKTAAAVKKTVTRRRQRLFRTKSPSRCGMSTKRHWNVRQPTVIRSTIFVPDFI